MRKTIILLLLVLIKSLASAQNAAIEAPTANGMNVVITVLSIIFIGIIVYLFLLDRKITKLEKTTEE
jgi:CcmD family protein